MFAEHRDFIAEASAALLPVHVILAVYLTYRGTFDPPAILATPKPI